LDLGEGLTTFHYKIEPVPRCRRVLRITQIEDEVFENMVWTKTFGCKREEVTEGWRKLRNDEFLGLYSSVTTTRMTTSGLMRRMGHVARMGDNRYTYRET
jgi:hypothetical protein